MLELTVFDRGKEVVLSFEHSLLSLSKWEARSHKPFLTSGPKSGPDLIDYYRDMLTSPEYDPDLVYRLFPEQLEQLGKYLSNPMTASVAPPPEPGTPRHTGEVLTSEVIYYQMVALRIPFEAQTWHINRLMMLIAIVSSRQTPPKKKSRGALLSTWDKINRQNREYFKSEG